MEYQGQLVILDGRWIAGAADLVNLLLLVSWIRAEWVKQDEAKRRTRRAASRSGPT